MKNNCNYKNKTKYKFPITVINIFIHLKLFWAKIIFFSSLNFRNFFKLCCFVTSFVLIVQQFINDPVYLLLTKPFGTGINFLILAHPVYKMWIIQEPNTLELWNNLHFEEKKTEIIYHV